MKTKAGCGVFGRQILHQQMTSHTYIGITHCTPLPTPKNPPPKTIHRYISISVEITFTVYFPKNFFIRLLPNEPLDTLWGISCLALSPINRNTKYCTGLAG